MRLQAFPKTRRLRRRADYLAVQHSGRKLQSEHLVLLVGRGHAAGEAATRVGLTVSSRVGGAVARNRLKRWMREHVRREAGALPGGDVVVIAKPSAASAPHEEIDGELRWLLARAREAR